MLHRTPTMRQKTKLLRLIDFPISLDQNGQHQRIAPAVFVLKCHQLHLTTYKRLGSFIASVIVLILGPQGFEGPMGPRGFIGNSGTKGSRGEKGLFLLLV